MRLVHLYLRSRLVGNALVLLTGIAVVTGLALHFSGGDLFVFGVVLLVLPIAAAAVIAAGTRVPFGESEQTGSYALPMLRLGHLLALLVWASGGFATAVVVLAPHEMVGLSTAGESVYPVEVAGWLVRNLLGFAGLSFITARWIGSGRSWITALVHGVLTLTIGATIIFGWPLRPAHDQVALIIATVLLVVGLAVVRTGARADRSDGDAE